MIPLVLALTLALAPLQGGAKPADAQKPPPKEAPAPKLDAEAVKVAVSELKAAFAKGKSDERIAAIARAAELPDAEVIAGITKGLKDEDPKVLGAAIDALRYLPHADALGALLATLERDKKLAKDTELSVRLVRAIGQHANAAAAEKLAAMGLDGEGGVVDARLLAIANVRSLRSVELLIELSRSASEEKVGPRTGTLRLALARLTGNDLGPTRQRWHEWWSAEKKRCEIKPEPPLMTKEMQLRWDGFWGIRTEPARNKARGERGDDPEGKGK